MSQAIQGAQRSPEKEFKPKPYAIFFDLGYVLIEWDRAAQMQPVAAYGMSAADCSRLTTRMLHLLEKSGGQQSPEPGSPLALWGECGVMPHPVCLWLAGKKTGVDLVQEAHAYCASCTGADHDPEELAILRQVACCLYDPIFNLQFIRPISDGIALLYECAAARGNDNLYLLSNYSRDQFILLEQEARFAGIFDAIPKRNRVVSGFVGTVDDEGVVHGIKPYRSIYEHVFATYDLAPEQCIFIDDQEENIRGARALGMHGIWLKDHDYGAVRAELEKLGVLRPVQSQAPIAGEISRPPEAGV
jgi:hypothetical protein